MPNTGPSEGWRIAAMARNSRTRSGAIESPMVVVVCLAERGRRDRGSRRYFPWGRPASRFSTDSATLALDLPRLELSSHARPAADLRGA